MDDIPLYDLDEAADSVGDDTRPFNLNKYGTGFSHDTHVMLAYTKAINSGAVEMRKGFWQTKQDKYGNAMHVYQPDTRKEFIETVKTLHTVMIADLDEEATPKINTLISKVETTRQELLAQEKKYYDNLDYQTKKLIAHEDNFFNTELIYYHNWLDSCVDIYREIMKELGFALARCRYLAKSKNIA